MSVVLIKNDDDDDDVKPYSLTIASTALAMRALRRSARCNYE